jgi:hypothetical protein
MYSKSRGTSEPATAGGTMRFVLKDGELHVFTADFATVLLAIRYGSKEKPGGHLLYK